MNLDKKLDKRIEYLLNCTNNIEIDDIYELKNYQPYLVDYGYDLLELGQLEKAYKLFSIGTFLNNQNPDILNGLGITLCEMGRTGESKKILERAVRLKPNDPITIANLAGVCWEICKRAGFERCYLFAWKKSSFCEAELQTQLSTLLAL